MGAKGPSSIDTVSPEIVPTIQVADISGQDPGARFTKYCAGYHTEAATAGNYSHLQLFNPATSQVDLIFDSFWLRNTSNVSTNIRIYDTAMPNQSANVSVVDVPGEDVFAWAAGVASMNGQIRGETHTSVRGSIIIGFVYSISTDTTPLPLGYRITPGRGITIVNVTGNVGIQGTFFWREVQRLP